VGLIKVKMADNRLDLDDSQSMIKDESPLH